MLLNGIDFKKKRCVKNIEPDEASMGWYVTLWESSRKYEILNSLRVDGDNKEDVIADRLLKI